MVDSLGDSAAKERIAASGTTIYSEPDDKLFIPTGQLERMLATGLRGLNLDYPLRTRAKICKQAVCTSLGYRAPASFKKIQPRFPAQDLDVYVQKNNNLQIWNEEVDGERRYALIRVNDKEIVTTVRVLTGEEVAQLDRTGTLTSKYQAKRRDNAVAEAPASLLVSREDTENLALILRPRSDIADAELAKLSPIQPPQPELTLSVGAVFGRLENLVGQSFEDPGVLQDRNRGEGLHRLVCEALGLDGFADRGQFPDVPCQALEVKLQTSPTIDLGLVSPDCDKPIHTLGTGIQHRDVRYAVFYGETSADSTVRITGFVLSTGADFFSEFRRFEGLTQNRKLQIPLPRGLFSEPEG